MGWIPTKEEIQTELQNYNDLSFFKKSKNILVTFIVAVSTLSLLLLGPIEAALGSGALYEILLNFILACFVYLNHRWAMIVFCAVYLSSKVLFIFSGVPPLSQIIFGAIAVVCTYSAYRVSTELKKARNKTVTEI